VKSLLRETEENYVKPESVTAGTLLEQVRSVTALENCALTG
jgi:hypothetical protein